VRGVRGFWLLVVAVAVAIGLGGAVARASGPPEVVVGDAQGMVFAHGQAGSHGSGQYPPLLFHNGQIMKGAAVETIYWGLSWGSAAFVGDKITGLTSFYQGVGSTPYANTTSEYTGTNGQVSTSVSYNGLHTDETATPLKDPGTSGVLAEVAKEITSPVANGYYPVYTDIPRGSASYCAYHSYGTVKGVPVQFAFFFKLDGDSGCDPQDTSTGHSQGLSALANVSGHELSEALTDPRNGGWYDRQGSENADKCAWTFNGIEMFTNGSKWQIQGNWSNNAATAKSGYTRGGCINGN
jgi:hypothetical protein